MMRLTVFSAVILSAVAVSAADVATNPAPVDLSGPQRGAIATWVQTAWPAATPANIERVVCKRRERSTSEGTEVGAYCYALERATLTAAQYANAVSNRRVRETPAPEDIAPDGTSASNVLYLHGPDFVSGSALTALADVAISVFEVPAGTLARLDFWKATDVDPDTGETTISYRGKATRIIDVTPTERLLCMRDRTCLGSL